MVITPGEIVFGASGVEYEVKEHIGSGGFGAVFRVARRGGNDVLAMKTLPTTFTDQTALKAFVNEGNCAVGIRHPNVIEYVFFHDGSKYQGLPLYILMEFADGGTLEALLARQGTSQFSDSELEGMFAQLISGMQAINEKLIHRDVKPDNILLSKGILKISDFGLAKVVTEATRASSFKGFGCLQYMAPEGWKFERNTIQLDIYSMGIVFYQLATLRHPFNVPTPDPQKWMEAHLYQPVPRPDSVNPKIGTRLSQIIMKMVEKDSANRFKTWDEVQRILGSAEAAAGAGPDLIQSMLQRRLHQDAAAQAAEAEERRKSDELTQFCKLVLSQAEQNIVLPLKALVAEFNRQYPGNKARDRETPACGGKAFDYTISFPSGKSVKVEFCVLLERDFVREMPCDPFVRPRLHKGRLTGVCLPSYKRRRIQGWGAINASDGHGFNVLLVEKPGEVYGELMILHNKMGILSSGRERPTPFAFRLEELEKEITLIETMHIYSTTATAFDATSLQRFVAQYV